LNSARNQFNWNLRIFSNKQFFFTLQKKESSSNPLWQKGTSLSKESRVFLWCIGFSSFDSIFVLHTEEHHHNSLAVSYYFCVAGDFCQKLTESPESKYFKTSFNSIRIALLHCTFNKLSIYLNKSFSSSCLQYKAQYMKCIYKMC